jgi:hypothetical protein
MVIHDPGSSHPAMIQHPAAVAIHDGSKMRNYDYDHFACLYCAIVRYMSITAVSCILYFRIENRD